MRSSDRAVMSSPLMRATPPKSHSVIPSTRTFRRRAIVACAISWASSEAKNASAVTTPAIQY
jgi:hypothetical protein